jgi:hypothetical protein
MLKRLLELIFSLPEEQQEPSSSPSSVPAQLAARPLDFAGLQHARVQPAGKHLNIGNVQVAADEVLDFAAPIGVVQAADLALVVEDYARLTHETCQPQLAALVFLLTDQPAALDRYFPITSTLAGEQHTAFYQLVREIIAHPGFDLRLFAEQQEDITHAMSSDIAHMVAGHLAEVFFARRDILECLLSSPRHIWLYTTPQAFKDGGGVAGGCYNPGKQCLQLTVSRLYEGFNGRTPGVAPFLHEFGHMLDYFDAGSQQMTRSSGFLPGLRPSDGAIFRSHARALFRKGKQIELDRYLRFYAGEASANDPVPIGHPYVFQSDSEFIAGYLEMFFRTPNYFEQQNPDLYNSFAEVFQQDPRQYWQADFPFYVRENQKFYRSGQQPREPGIHVPAE